MATPEPDTSQLQAAALSIPERQLLFCIASKTDWKKVGITPATVAATVIRGLIARDPAGEHYLTKEGRAVFAALVADGSEMAPPIPGAVTYC
jgi:hypothetical protein